MSTERKAHLVSYDLSELPDNALVLCINCNRVDTAKAWETDSVLGTEYRCPICQSHAVRLVTQDDLDAERVPLLPEDDEE